MVIGCEAKLPLKRYLLEVEDQQLNATITSDNVCLKNIVEQKQVVYYNLDVSDCLEDETFGYNYLEVEARIFQQCADSHEWSVLVNTEGVLIPIEGARESSNGTFVDFIGMAILFLSYKECTCFWVFDTTQWKEVTSHFN